MQLGRANLIVVHLRDTEKTKNVVKCRTPQVVEFAVSPQVGQTSTACPTCEALAIEGNGSAHFPRQAEIAGRHQEF
jgi:hypothetical protein